MRGKIPRRKIHAYRTKDPAEVLRIIGEAEALTFPDAIYNIGMDIADTVAANVPEREAADTAACLLMRAALILHREGRLTEAPPRATKPKKKAAPEGDTA